MKDYHLLLAFITAFSVVLLATPALIKVAKLKHLVDEPHEERKKHATSIPTIGGVIIFSAFIFSSFLWLPVNEPKVIEGLSQFMFLMASLILLFFVGVKDDIIGMSPMKKLIAHVMVGFILVVMGGIKISSFHGLLGMDIILPDYASILLSIFIYIVVVNSINLIDGVDGLASGVGLFSTIAFGLWFSYMGELHWALVSFSLCGALMGFLVFNFNPARIFMGDSGSLIIGAVISVLAIQLIESPVEALPEGYQHVSTPVLAMAILAYPLLDTLRVFIIRTLKGKSPLSADRNHLHHKLQDRGLGHKKTVIIIYIFSIVMITQAYLIQFEDPNISFAISLGISLLFIALVFAGRKKKVTRANKNILTLLMLICLNGWGQLQPDNLHYLNRIDLAEKYFSDDQKNHSSILPAIRVKTFERGPGYLTLSNSEGKLNANLYPLTNLTAGFEFDNQGNSQLLYDAGVGAGIDLSTSRFFMTGKFMPYATQSAFVRDSVQDVVKMDPGASRQLFDNGFHQNELILGYRPNRFFTFMGGQGRNFFGEGYRSLILSDNSMPNPFFKIETAFSSIKYVNLYQMWKDNTIDPTNKSLDKKKFAAMHYISWNVTREFNISIFETVIWQSNDTLINRGFDPNYLNPVVFYRPVEYGNGSADNVLLGANMSFKFNKKHSIYTQIILDDFLLAEIRARSRWWANKYGFQFGYKSMAFLDVENLYFQAEFNTVRPFTFSHKHSGQAYGNLNASVTHPIGANFFEILGIASYKTEKFRFTNKLTYSSYGVDSSDVSYGQNIFVSYSNRDGEYDHFIMQGLKKNVLNETVIVEMPLIEKIDLYFNLTYNWRMELTPAEIRNNHYLTVGIRSRIWNAYTDY